MDIMKKRVAQAYIGKGVKFFGKAFLKKYKLVEYHNTKEPLVMFGMYNKKDRAIFLSHQAPVIVVWCGSDSMTLAKKGVASIIKNRQARHITTCSCTSSDLNRQLIQNTILPITPAELNLNPCKRGDSIYFYGGDENNFYGINYLPEIAKRTRLNIIKTKGQYSKEEVIQKYRESFIGLRLTKHDGLATTVLEMGMMGRRCIHNWGGPTSIKWDGIGGMVESILWEYENREDNNENISADMKRFLDISDEWLYV